ncbi:YjbQ family protein [Aggregicoccus sp. 17bor-14]|uniref:secondary thiamine-phosphate synthase enzyme YjbQ n=1 Tax=Myxococcaceae TaxID=31 RepID=UPI0012F33415|nr:YjbQ family protein [Simulacricoccus sp. 17bor-14]MRI90886.1 YjbQ family protein [Aggregicoccus sp. 17bor-14]
MSCHASELSVATRGRGFHDLTREVQAAVRASGIATGLCTVFLHHTSASLLLCENADPDVQRDLEAFFARLVKDGDPLFRHDAEGPDDMPSHVRAVLTGNSLGLPVREGRCDLGTWQGVYLWEHRTAAHRRRVSVTVTG